MPILFNPGKKKGIFMIPSGGTKSPTPPVPSFSSTKSLDFDGIDDYVETSPIYSELDGQTEVTISLWIKPTLGSANEILLYLNRAPSNDNSSFVGRIVLNSTGKIVFQIGWYWTGGTSTTATGVVTANVWNHILVTYNGSLSTGSRAKIFINSVDETLTDGITFTSLSNATSPLAIGRGNVSFPYCYGGKLDEAAIWDTALSPTDVAAVFGGGTPPDLAPLSPITWYRMGENSTFKSPQILMPEQSNKDKVSNYSMEFDGTDDYVDCGNSTDLQITGALTVSSWVKFTSGNLDVIVSKDENGANRCWALWGDYLNVPAFNITSSNTHYLVSGTAAIDDGDWHHVVGVFEPSTAVRIYVDGILDGENTTAIPATIDNDPVSVKIGCLNVGGFNFPGKIDEVSIFNTALSAGNITSMYNLGQPTDLTSLSPVAWWKMGEEATYDAVASEWTIPDQAGSNDGTSANMTIEDRTGDAPDSENNSLSYNMDAADIDPDTPPN